jgi:hypothetical protein
VCLDADGRPPRARQRSDTPDLVDPKAIQAALELSLAVVARLDKDLSAAAPDSIPEPSRR